MGKGDGATTRWREARLKTYDQQPAFLQLAKELQSHRLTTDNSHKVRCSASPHPAPPRGVREEGECGTQYLYLTLSQDNEMWKHCSSSPGVTSLPRKLTPPGFDLSPFGSLARVREHLPRVGIELCEPSGDTGEGVQCRLRARPEWRLAVTWDKARNGRHTGPFFSNGVARESGQFGGRPLQLG